MIKLPSSGKAFELLFGQDVHILAPSASSYTIKLNDKHLSAYFCLCTSSRCRECCNDQELHEIVLLAKNQGATRIILRTGESRIRAQMNPNDVGDRFTRRYEWPHSGSMSIQGLPVTCIAEFYEECRQNDSLDLDENYRITLRY